jgi:hypothetical protein
VVDAGNAVFGALFDRTCASPGRVFWVVPPRPDGGEDRRARLEHVVRVEVLA